MTELKRGTLVMYKRNGPQDGVGLVVSNNVANQYSPFVSLAPMISQKNEKLLPSQVLIPKSIGMLNNMVLVGEQTGPIEKKNIKSVINIEMTEDLMLQVNRALFVHFAILESN